MKIKCIINNIKNLPILASGYSNDEIVDIDKIYVVYAMTTVNNCIWYCIVDENFHDSPRRHLGPLFTLEDKRYSRYWKHAFIKNYLYINDDTWTFPEWIADEFFILKLIDGEKKEVEIFKKYKLLMDLEFPDPDVSEKATALEDGWVMCPTCIDAWQPNPLDGMTVCPICHQTMHNPFYEG